MFSLLSVLLFSCQVIGHAGIKVSDQNYKMIFYIFLMIIIVVVIIVVVVVIIIIIIVLIIIFMSISMLKHRNSFVVNLPGHNVISYLICCWNYFWFNWLIANHQTVIATLPFSTFCMGNRMFDANYRQTSNIRRTLTGDRIVDHSVVVGALPVRAAPTTSSFST